MHVLLCAGGTGGHLFPAAAVAHELATRGHTAALVTDRRAEGLIEGLPVRRVAFLPAATPSVRDPLRFARAGLTNAWSLARALRLVRGERADVIIGFGGYPTVPPVLAARALGVPVVLHEANAVVGRANRFLARGAHLATAFAGTKGVPQGVASAAHVGVPLRPAVLAARAAFEAPGERFACLVFGGSQGAHVFAGLVPEALAALPSAQRARLDLTMQVRAEDRAAVEAALAPIGVAATLAPFFRDLPQRIAGAHLVIARSGASTVAELSVLGRPSLLVPLPGALDQDQAHNAAAMEAAGGGVQLDQARLTGAALGAGISELMEAPARLEAMASAARTLARPDAAAALVDYTETAARRPAPATLRTAA